MKEVSVKEKNQESEEIKEDDQKKCLTLMLYMAADNDLESYALQNLKMLEAGKSDEINVLVLLDRSEGYDETDGNWTDTRLFEVCHDADGVGVLVSKRISCSALGLSCDENTELDMANYNVLRKFVEFGISNYEAENYALVIWGHGTGWRYVSCETSRAVAIDDKTGSYMPVSDLGKALRGQGEQDSQSGHGLCVIGFDTCFGGTFENVYELKDTVEYTVACPGVTPAGGWNYKKLLEEISATHKNGKKITPAIIAQSMAKSSSVQPTIFNNSNLENLMEAFETYAREVSESIQTTEQKRTAYQNLFNLKSYSYTQYPCDKYLDLAAFADLYLSSQNVSLKNAAENLKQAIGQSTICINGTGTNSCSDTDTAGIGIHFIPLVSAHTAAPVHSNNYIKNPNYTDQCKFIKESEWWVPTVNGNSGSLLDKLFYNGV